MASETKTIVTHSGSFHADEALACFMLHQTPEFKGAKIVRSRDPAVIDKADIVVDVGAVYDPSTHRYDHHQAGFTHTFDEFHRIKLSSAGLIYKHFGRGIIQSALKTNDKETDVLFIKIYEAFIEAIDGIDNGVERYSTEVKSNYSVSTDLSSRVGFLNPRWNEPHPDPDSGFHRAVEMTGAEFMDRVNFYGLSWLPARSIVEGALRNRKEMHGSGEIMLLPQFCPWRDHLSILEVEQGIEGLLKYVVFQDTNGTWRVQCVPQSNSSFGNRKSLPKSWRGYRDDELSKISGIEGCVFVHATGFIGGTKTYDGAFQMATKALNAPDAECE